MHYDFLCIYISVKTRTIWIARHCINKNRHILEAIFTLVLESIKKASRCQPNPLSLSTKFAHRERLCGCIQGIYEYINNHLHIYVTLPFVPQGIDMPEQTLKYDTIQRHCPIRSIRLQICGQDYGHERYAHDKASYNNWLKTCYYLKPHGTSQRNEMCY